MTEKWIIEYEGPPIKPPLEDFKDHLRSFLREFLRGVWIIAFAVAIILAFLIACLCFTKPELIPRIAVPLAVYLLSVGYGFYSAIGILCEWDEHRTYCSVPPTICTLKRTRCYVKRCPHYKGGFCARKE